MAALRKTVVVLPTVAMTEDRLTIYRLVVTKLQNRHPKLYTKYILYWLRQYCTRTYHERFKYVIVLGRSTLTTSPDSVQKQNLAILYLHRYATHTSKRKRERANTQPKDHIFAHGNDSKQSNCCPFDDDSSNIHWMDAMSTLLVIIVQSINDVIRLGGASRNVG